MNREDEERKRRLEEARDIIANTTGVNNSSNTLYNQRLQEANNIINSINSNNMNPSNYQLPITNGNNAFKIDELSNYLNNIKAEREQRNENIVSNVPNNKEEQQDRAQPTISEKQNNNKVVAPTVNKQESNFREQSQSNLFSVNKNNTKIATQEESKNIKKADTEDIFLLSNGEIDYRSNPQRRLDEISGTLNNLAEGISDFIPSVVDYASTGTEVGTKIITKLGLEVLGYSEEEAEKLSSDVKNKFKEISPLSLLNSLLNNKYTEQRRNEQIKINSLRASSNPLASKLSELAPSLGDNIISMGITAANPVLGAASFMISAGGNYLDDARNRGMTDEQAFGYATVMGALEGGTEYIITGGMVDKIGRKFLGKGLSEEVLNSFGVSVAENFFQEAIMEPLQETAATVFGGKEAANWEDMGQRFLESGIDGIISAIILGGASVGIASAENVVNKSNPTSEEYNKAFVDTVNSGKVDVKGIIEGGQEAIILNQNMERFYTATYNQDGNLENVEAVQGKAIDNPNKNVNVNPVIIKNRQNDYYNVIDGNTGLLLDSTPYQSLIEAQTNFSNKMINLDNAAINNVNDRIAKANIAINQVINETSSIINADRKVINNTKTTLDNVMEVPENSTSNVNTNIDTNLDSTNGVSVNVDTNTIDMSNRNFENVSNKKVLPYQEEHSELQPEIQEMANRFIEDLENSTEGRRYKSGDSWTGQKRNTTKELAYIKDNTGASWSQIGQALEDIANNKANYALAKKVEIILDDALTNGYRNIYGQNIMPNNNYINKKSNYENIQQSNNTNNDFELDDYRVFGEKLPRRRNTAQTSQNEFTDISNSNTTNYMSQNENTVVKENKSQLQQDIEKFSNQVDAVLNGTFPKRSMLTLLSHTPKPLIDIGLQDFPITMTQRHLDTIMNETGNDKNANYHGLGVDTVKQLPEAISNPLDIVKSNTKDDSIVLTTYLADNQDRTIIASIRIDGKGLVNQVLIDTNVMTSAYGRNNYDKFMQDNIKNGNLLYDIDRGVIKKVDVARLQLPGSTNSTTKTNGSISTNSIARNSKNVNSNTTSSTSKSMQNNKNNTTKTINSLNAIKTKYANQTDQLNIFENKDNTISINNIVVKQNLRNKGIGQSILNDIIDYADKTNKTITLTPTSEYLTKNKLINWYKRNGFVENKGKNTDFSISDTMYKLPKNNMQNNKNVKDNGIRAERTNTTAEYDNQGNRLTKAQREFFKDSKVRDENGKLKVVYHGTNNEFTVFDKNKSGQSNSNAKIGFWFTETKEGASKFAESVWYGTKKSSEVFEVYLNIENPKIYKSIDNTNELNNLEEQMKNLKKKIRQIENRNINIEINSSAIRYASDEAELIDIARENGIVKKQEEFVTSAQEYKKLLDNYDNVEKEYNNKRYNDAYELFRTDIYKIAGKDANDANFGGTGMWLENESEILQKYKDNLERQGYDGIIIQGTNYDSETMGRNNTQYVVFNSNQIKNVTNKKPTTSNPDIRYESTNNTASQPYDARKYEKNVDFVNYLKENNYLKTLFETDNSQGETYAHSPERLIEQEIRKLEETNGFDNSIPVTKLTDIDREIENYLGKTIGKGHFRERARGIYNQKYDTISVKEYKDLDNVYHELGHALDLGGRIKVDKSSLSDELLAAVKRHGGYENETIGVQLDEGFAEILKTYAINKDIVKEDYPKSYRVLEDFKNSNVEFGKFISKIQQETYNYIHQSSQNRVLSNQSIGEQTDKAPITVDSIKRNTVKLIWDSNYSIKEMANEFSKASGRNVEASKNVYLLTRLASGVDNKAISMISDGYIDLNGKKVMPGLNKLGEILGNNPQRWNDLRAYLVAQRDLEYKAKSLKTGVRTMDSKAVVQQFYNDTQIQEASKVVYDTLDGVLQYAVDNGVMNEETAHSLRESNAFYVPFQRVIQGRGNQIGRRGAVSNIINKRTGSELDIKDVLENIVTNSVNIIQQVENNNILRTLAEQGEEAGMNNNIFQEIPAPMKKVGTAQLQTWENELKRQGIDTSNLDLEKTIDIFVPNNNITTEKDGSHIVSFFEQNGNRKYLQFYRESTDIFNALMGLDKNANSKILKLMRAANMPLRYGATMANVGFAIPNMISDTVQATIYSEAGFIPVVDNILGVLDVLGATNKTVRNFLNQVAPEYAERINRIYDIYQQTGASSSTRMSQYRKSTQEIMRDIYGTKNSETLGIKESFKPLKRLMDLLTYIPELSENSTRFRVFERNYEAAKNKGNPELDARIKAAIESRDATQDFGRTGTLMHEVNQLIPFSAARVGSAYTFTEKVKANPKRTATRVAILITVAMAIKALGYDDDEIEELNQRKKDDNFVLKVGDTIVTIKKPQGILRSIINLAEYVQDLATGHIEEGKEGEKLVDWTTNAIMDNMPADSVTGLVPNAIAPVVENAINKDFYYNTDIVKSYDLDLPDEQQYYDYTSQLAIWLGQIFNYSPAKIDNLISGYLGGLGTQLTNTIDWISGKMGLSAEEPAMGAEDNAVGKRFVVNVNENSASVDEIYKREEELTKKQNGGTITEKEIEELENIKNGISKLSALNKQIKAIKQDLTMSGEEKAEQIRPLQEQKVDVARQSLGKDSIYTENTDELNSLEFYPSRSTLSYNGYTLELTEDMKQEYEDLSYDLYKKYKKQGLYSEEYLDKLKSKCKDVAKKQMMQKYKSKLTKSK